MCGAIVQGLEREIRLFFADATLSESNNSFKIKHLDAHLRVAILCQICTGIAAFCAFLQAWIVKMDSKREARDSLLLLLA